MSALVHDVSGDHFENGITNFTCENLYDTLTVLAACKASDEQLAAKYGSPNKLNDLDEAEDDLYVAAIKWDMFETPENTATLHIATSKYRELLDSYLEVGK